jgi:hypothetical protein
VAEGPYKKLSGKWAEFPYASFQRRRFPLLGDLCVSAERDLFGKFLVHGSMISQRHGVQRGLFGLRVFICCACRVSDETS